MSYPTGIPAAWYPDPSGRHQFRYWQGASWTDAVADDGRTASDPLPPSSRTPQRPTHRPPRRPPPRP